MSTDTKKPRQMLCRCCGQTRPRKDCKTVAGTGLVCAECVPELQPSAPAPVPAPKPAPEIVKAPAVPRHRSTARPRPTITAPWTPRQVDRLPTEPAQPASDAAIPPGVKVTVRPTPRGRFEVDPATVTPLFSALGPGRYLESEGA